LRRNESPVGVVEVRGVGKWQGCLVLTVRRFDGGGRGLLVHDAEIATRGKPAVPDCANGWRNPGDTPARLALFICGAQHAKVPPA
jgi:hypothetical protein